MAFYIIIYVNSSLIVGGFGKVKVRGVKTSNNRKELGKSKN